MRIIKMGTAAVILLLSAPNKTAMARLADDPNPLSGGALPPTGAMLSFGPPAPKPAVDAGSTGVAGVLNGAVPTSLHTLAEQASRSHPQVKGAESLIKAANFDLKGAKWLRFPSLTVEALGATRGSANSSQDGMVLNAVVEQPIWAGGRVSAAIDRAKAQLFVQRAAVDEAARDIVLRVVQAYFDVVAGTRRVEILKDVLLQHRALADTIARRVDQQISPRSDLDLARARGAQAEQQMALARAQREGGLSALVELVGTNSVTIGDMPKYDAMLHHPAREGAVEQAVLCDPRATRFSALAEVARAEQRSAKAALMPQLVGQLSSNEVLGQRVGVALRAQTGNGLSQAAAARGAGERALASQEAISGAQRDLREALRLDFVNNSAVRDRIESSATAADSSLQVIESYKRQFIAGRRTWLDVMNALQEYTNNRLAVIDAQTAAQLTAVRIALRTCSWQPRPLFLNMEAPNDHQ